MKYIYSFCFIVLSIFLYTSCSNKPKEETVKVVINKVRTRTDLAELLAKKMNTSVDAYKVYFFNNDSLTKLGKDSATIMSAIIPNTYIVYKNATPAKVLKKIMDYENTFWDPTRKEKAAALGLNTHQIITIASIVEEETIKDADKGNIASVYLNRLNKKMPLQADPTIKFALDSFSITRIYEKYIKMAATSPYNTYTHLGLPPGPICTPSTKTIDAVLNAPKTDYLYFVAQPNFSDLSNFTNDYKIHLKNAAVYHQFLDSVFKARKK
jgi:UPF0755 protein